MLDTKWKIRNTLSTRNFLFGSSVDIFAVSVESHLIKRPGRKSGAERTKLDKYSYAISYSFSSSRFEIRCWPPKTGSLVDSFNGSESFRSRLQKYSPQKETKRLGYCPLGFDFPAWQRGQGKFVAGIFKKLSNPLDVRPSLLSFLDVSSPKGTIQYLHFLSFF